MKRLSIKVGEYQKDGQTKGEYVKLGVILNNDKGEYVLLDPTVNLAGCLMRQRILNQKKQIQTKGDKLVCNIFTDQPQNQQPQQNQQQSHQTNVDPNFDDDIPF